MTAEHHIWRSWMNTLHQWGLEDLAEWLLESAGPFSLIAAQGIYLGQPLLRHLLPDEHWSALAELLEQPSQQRKFIACLREESGGELG